MVESHLWGCTLGKLVNCSDDGGNIVGGVPCAGCGGEWNGEGCILGCFREVGGKVREDYSF